MTAEMVKNEASGLGMSGTKLFTVTARASDPTMGSVIVQTVSVPSVERSTAKAVKGYPSGTVLFIEAHSREGYRFAGWSDGNGNAARTIKVTADAEYVANFERVPENDQPAGDTPLVGDTPSGTGAGGGSGVLGTAMQNTATAAKKQDGIMQLIRKWWWAILLLACMIHDMKGGQ